MKHLAVFLVAGALASAADFTNGQAARMVIGQPTFTAQLPDSSDVVLGGASGLAYANGMLFVADSNRVGATPENNRILIFRNLPDYLHDPTAPPPQADGARCQVCTGKADSVLGQPDFTKFDKALSQTGFRQPTGVATDGTRLVVADTDNNRVLIWNRIPADNNVPADVVLGQPDFKTNLVNAQTGDPRVPSARTLRGPQGVWIQGGKLFVADTQNHRVLVWNSVPTANFTPANLVLGQPGFAAAQEPDLTKNEVNAQANTLLNPVSVTSDGVRLYVADLGHNRVLIWNSIPTQNQQSADIVIGQADMTTADANNSSKVCTGTTDDAGTTTYPAVCGATLNFPRYALSDGTRLFIADGGNDRVLVYNTIPNANGAKADVVLGQINDQVNLTTESGNPLGQSSSDSFSSPMALAWDGQNLFVSDPVHRRVLVFTIGGPTLPVTAVRNSASLDIYALGSVSLAGDIQEKDEVTVTVSGRNFKYTVKKDDTLDAIVQALVNLINSSNDGAGDPDVLATPNLVREAVVLTARKAGEEGNSVAYSVATAPDTALIQASAAAANLAGGQDAAKIAPGTLVTVLGDNLSDTEAWAPQGADPLPKELGGVQVFFDGIQAPLLYVGPGQVNAQLPFEVSDTNSISAYVRTKRGDGRITVSTAVGVPVISANPGIFAKPGTDPRPGIVMHGSTRATGTVSVDGSVKTGDTATVVIRDREYTYTVQDGDTLESIRDALIGLINQGDPEVQAFAAGLFTRIRLQARVEGPAGNGIPYTAKSGDGAEVIMTPTTSALGGSNSGPVTAENPAVPGEVIKVYATGLGIVKPDDAKFAMYTGFTYKGPYYNEPDVFVSSMAGGKTANVLYAGMVQGQVGTYEVDLELNSDLPTDPATQLTIAQDVYVSNIVTFPVKNPTDDTTTTPNP